MTQSHGVDAAVAVILHRAHSLLSATSERLLVERLRLYLDEHGVDALAAFSGELLPYLQALAATLPKAIQSDSSEEVIETARAIGDQLHRRGITLPELIAEWGDLHDRLLRGFGAHLRESDRALALAVARISRIALEVGQAALLSYEESAVASLKALALSDSLTNLANRRYFDERFGEELLRAQRLGHSLALVLVDVDGLKGINDTFGHSMGDQLLNAMATILRTHTRGIDLVARIGGDEFALLLPETDQQGAARLLQRLSLEAEGRLISGQPVRFSAGIAVYPGDGATAHDLTRHADAALYRAKRGERG